MMDETPRAPRRDAEGPSRSSTGPRGVWARLQCPKLLAWALGVAAVAIYAQGFLQQPPFDGDAYEYAEVASNLVRHGEAIQTHVRYPALTDVTLPADAGRRLNLYALICLPLQLAFGSSVLVVILPFLCVVFLLPRVTLYALEPWFGAAASLSAATVLLLHPHLLMLFVHDPNVDFLVAMFMLLSFAALRTRRFVWMGLWFALGFLVKVNLVVLAPALLLGLWVGERGCFRRRELWQGAAVALAVMLPYVLHVIAYQLSGAGMAETSGLRFQGLEDMRQGSLVDWYFQVHLAPAPVAKSAADVVTMAAINGWRYLVGSEWLFGQRPGALEVLGLLMVPLAFIGLRSVKPRADRWALGTFCVLFTLFHTVIALEGEVRWFVPGFLVLWAAGFCGAQRLLGASTGFRVAVAYMTLIMTPGLVVEIYSRVQHPGAVPAHYESLRDLGEVVGAGDGPVFTKPFFSISYYADRITVPFPSGSMDEVLQLADAWRAEGLLMQRHREGACLPWDAALPPTASLDQFCYYRFAAPAASIRAEAGEALLAFAPMDYQLELQGHLMRTPEWAALMGAGRVWPPIALALAWGLCLFIARRRGRLLPWVGVLVVSALGGLIIFVGTNPDSPHGASLKTLEEQQLEAFLGADATAALQFEPIAPGWSLCPGHDPEHEACPSPLSGFRCVPEADVLVEGCPTWSRANMGPTAAEATDTTLMLENKLAARAAQRQKEGREVLRLPRAVVSRPHR